MSSRNCRWRMVQGSDGVWWMLREHKPNHWRNEGVVHDLYVEPLGGGSTALRLPKGKTESKFPKPA